jgi:hypothetical protein
VFLTSSKLADLAGPGIGNYEELEQILPLSLVKMPSGPNAFEISDIQEDEIAASPGRRSECNNLTLRRKPPNGIFAYHR